MDSIKENWDAMARAYEGFNNSTDSYSYNIEWPTIKELLPDMEGKRILDVGCGTGIFTFLLETLRPKALVGLDLSPQMLKIAKMKGAGSIARFIQGDAARLNEYVKGEFDLIFSSTTLHYIKDLTSFFENLTGALAENGTVILSLIHPVYSAMYPVKNGDAFPTDDQWQVRYLDKSLRAYVQPWLEYNDDYEDFLSVSYHHLFGDYINGAVKAGLKIAEVREPLPPESWKTDCPERYDAYVETPTYMILKLVKQQGFSA